MNSFSEIAHKSGKEGIAGKMAPKTDTEFLVPTGSGVLTHVHGLNLENWQAELAEAKEPFNLGRLIRLVKEYHLLNPVIVDCTSSQAVADQYADFLREGFHVVTPNKKANTSSMDYYHQLRFAAAKSRRKFLYGLPLRSVSVWYSLTMA